MKNTHKKQEYTRLYYGRKTEDGRQRTEDRGRRTEVRRDAYNGVKFFLENFTSVV